MIGPLYTPMIGGRATMRNMKLFLELQAREIENRAHDVANELRIYGGIPLDTPVGLTSKENVASSLTSLINSVRHLAHSLEVYTGE